MAFTDGKDAPGAGDRNPILIEDIPGLVGQVFEGIPILVTDEERSSFERITHVSDAYPQDDAPEFPDGIIEGFHTLSLLDAMVTLARPFDPETTWGLNYGLDRVRFIEPVRYGSVLRSTFEVREVKEKGEGRLVLYHCEVVADGSDSPALVADWWLYVAPRQS